MAAGAFCGWRENSPYYADVANFKEFEGQNST